MNLRAPYIILGLLILLLNIGVSQTMIIGKVSDSDNFPIPGANIYLEGTYDGTTTDEGGNFKFLSKQEGNHKLIVSFLGYNDINELIILNTDTLFFNFKLRENALELESVVITTGAFEASGEHKREVLKPLDILTTAGATGDIAGSLNTLPGTQTVGESGRLFVRGGEGYETKTFIDGMQVLDFYSPTAPNTPGRTRFMPYMFSGTSFSTGGYSAEYGQALSSALVLNSKFKASQNRIDISLMSVGGDIGTSRTWANSSLSAKAQYTNLGPYQSLISQDIEWIQAPVSYEGSSSFQLKTSNTGILKIFGHFNNTNFTLNKKEILNPEIKTKTALNNSYLYGNAVYVEEVGSSWILKSGLSYTRSLDNTSLENSKFDQMDNGIHVKFVLSNEMNGNIALKVGSEFFNRNYYQDYGFFQNGFANRSDFSEKIGAGFAESDIYFTKNLLARVGLRSEYNFLLNNFRLDPRLSLAFKTSEKGQVSLAFGTFQQTPERSWLILSNELEQEKALHYILNYQYTSLRRTFRAEIYHKKYHDLVTFESALTQENYSFANNGSGYAKGFDVFWRDNQSWNNIDYWISYSYLDTERLYQDFPNKSIPPFASKHNFSIVYKHFISDLKSQVGLTYAFASKRSFHDPNQDGFMLGRTPNYHDLSGNISYLMRQDIIIHFSASNLFGFNQIFGYDFSPTPDSDGFYPGRAIRPPAKRFLFLGVFITFSEESIMNQLPNL